MDIFKTTTIYKKDIEEKFGFNRYSYYDFMCFDYDFEQCSYDLHILVQSCCFFI